MYTVILTSMGDDEEVYTYNDVERVRTEDDMVVIRQNDGDMHVSARIWDVSIKLKKPKVYVSMGAFLDEVYTTTNKGWLRQILHAAVTAQQDYMTAMREGGNELSDNDLADAAYLTSVEDDLDTAKPESWFEKEAMSASRMAIAYIAVVFSARFAEILRGAWYADVQNPVW